MKIKNLFLTFIMLFTLTAFTSCNKSKKAEVQLVSVTGSRTALKEEGKKEARRVLKANEGETVETPAVTEEEYVLDTLGYNVLVIPTSVMQYDITINLNNPYDHSIQDFRIQTDDTTLKMYNSNLDRWDVIDTTKSIKWLGADNQSFKFTLLSAAEESVTSIKITEILYLDRRTKTAENVNLSTGPDYVDVIKADVPSIEKVKVYQDAQNYITVDYRVNFGEGVKNVKINDELCEDGKVYSTKYGVKPKVTWEVPYKETTMSGSFEKDFFTSLFDLYGIGFAFVGLPKIPSTLFLRIEYNPLCTFNDEIINLKFNIKINGESAVFYLDEVLRYTTTSVYDSSITVISVDYYFDFSTRELKDTDVFSVYVLNGEEEILLIQK